MLGLSSPARPAQNAKGVILDVNARWREFAQENGGRSDFVEANYLTVCACATGGRSREATAAAAGIRDVIAGRTSEFLLD